MTGTSVHSLIFNSYFLINLQRYQISSWLFYTSSVWGDPTLPIFYLLTSWLSKFVCSTVLPSSQTSFPPALMASFQLPGLNTHLFPHQHIYINQELRPIHGREHVVFLFLHLGFLPTFLKSWCPVVHVLKFPEATRAMLLFPCLYFHVLPLVWSFLISLPSLPCPIKNEKVQAGYRSMNSPWHLFLFLRFQLSINYWKSIMNQNVSWISWYYS